MSRALVLLLLTACSVAEEPWTGDEFASRADPIINGTACSAAELPSAVAILTDGEIDFGSYGKQQVRSPTCTGTLIAPDVVLAAAHCVDMSISTMGFGQVTRESYAVTFEPDLVSLSKGETSIFPADTVRVRSWHPHEQFDIQSFSSVSGPGLYFDIALLFLERPILHVRPEVVINAVEALQLKVGAPVEIAGWGMSTVGNGPMSPGPSGRKICATSFVNELGLSEMQIGNDSSTSRKCHGDSGGPSYLSVETPHDIKRRVVGITSHAYDDRDCAVGGVDTRVDAFIDWLDAEMKKGCANGQRTWCEVSGLIPASYYDAPVEKEEQEPLAGSGGETAEEGGCATGSVTALALLAALLRRRRF